MSGYTELQNPISQYPIGVGLNDSDTNYIKIESHNEMLVKLRPLIMDDDSVFDIFRNGYDPIFNSQHGYYDLQLKIEFGKDKAIINEPSTTIDKNCDLFQNNDYKIEFNLSKGGKPGIYKIYELIVTFNCNQPVKSSAIGGSTYLNYVKSGIFTGANGEIKFTNNKLNAEAKAHLEANYIGGSESYLFGDYHYKADTSKLFEFSITYRVKFKLYLNVPESSKYKNRNFVFDKFEGSLMETPYTRVPDWKANDGNFYELYYWLPHIDKRFFKIDYDG